MTSFTKKLHSPSKKFFLSTD